jgi:hypothetical protein
LLLPERARIIEVVRGDFSPGSNGHGGVHPESVRRLDGATGQVEALSRFLEECRRHASRVALLVLRDGRAEVWKSVGLSGAGVDRRTLEPSEAIDRAIAGVPQQLTVGNDVSRALGADDAAAAVLVPFVVREKVSGAVYADGGRGALDPEAVAVLTYLAGLVVDRLAKRKLVPAPPLAPWEITEPEEISSPEGPLASPEGNGSREEARRFAHLLASEIKLYNEHAVAVGRKHGNLYALLSGDIERGRALYEERVPREARSGADYYYEELVEVLAGGDSNLLGSGLNP